MKTMMLGCLILPLAASIHGQGTIQFGNDLRNNLGVPVFRAPIYGPDPSNSTRSVSGQSSLGVPAGATVYGGALLQGTGFTMALYAGPAGATDPNSLVLVTTTTFRTASSDVLPAGLVATREIAIPGVAPGEIARLQIRVWDNQGGTLTTWAEILASPTTPAGSTPLFDSPALGGVGVPEIDPPLMTGWTSFNIVAVPEPSVIALGALGSAALFVRWLRRSWSKPSQSTRKTR